MFLYQLQQYFFFHYQNLVKGSNLAAFGIKRHKDSSVNVLDLHSAVARIHTHPHSWSKVRPLFLGAQFIKCEKSVTEAWNHLWVFTCAHREPDLFRSRTASVSPMAFKHCQNVNFLLLPVPTPSDRAGRWLAGWGMLTRSAGPPVTDSDASKPCWVVTSHAKMFIWPFIGNREAKFWTGLWKARFLSYGNHRSPVPCHPSAFDVDLMTTLWSWL